MSSTTVVGISLATSIAVACIFIFLMWLSNTYSINSTIMKWIVFPISCYAVALGFNAMTQAIVCKTIEMKQVSLISLMIPGAVLISLLLTLLQFVRSPIEVAVPIAQRNTYGLTFAIAFYSFWASMFGNALSSNFITAC